MKDTILSALILVLASFTLAPIIPPTMAQAQNIQINIYPDQEAELTALEQGSIDIIDSPIPKEWIDKWTLLPEQIALRDYSEHFMVEIDLNNQKWPTGDSGSKMYNSSRPQSTKAAEFRKAIACLTNRDKMVSEILNNNGHRMDLPILPSRSEYLDMTNYTLSGLIHDYDKARATEILTSAGFTDTDGNGVLNDPLSSNDLAPITFCIRQDDPTRKAIGEMLTAELTSVGIPVNALVTDRDICFKNVMITYEYNMYTGGWSLDRPSRNQHFNLFSPHEYYDMYSTSAYDGPETSWSANYPGFCNAEFDSWATEAKYPDTIENSKAAAKVCGYLFLKYCAVIPLYCTKAVKAHRTSLTDIVNDGTYGVDNYWTFLNVGTLPDSMIDWGFKSGIAKLNAVVNYASHTWAHSGPAYADPEVWEREQKILCLVYDGLLNTNPFDPTQIEPMIATDYTISTWDTGTPHDSGQDNPATVINFTLRSDIYWHNTTGGARRLLTAYDVNFSFYFVPPFTGCYCYMPYDQFNRSVVVDSTHLSIYYNKKNAWLVERAGQMPIVNPDIWSHITPSYKVYDFDPSKSDINTNGILDLAEDGCGPWTFVSRNDSSILLHSDPQYYLNETYIENRLAELFHQNAGDVNYDGITNVRDLGFMARAIGTDSNMTSGTSWNQYNKDCDFDGDGDVDALDLAVVTSNYGRTMG